MIKKKIIKNTLCIAASVMIAAPVPSYAANAKKNVKPVITEVKKITKKTEKKGLNYTKATIYAGKTKKLKLKENKDKVKWLTSNKKIATVSSKGVVKGIKAGTVKITAKANSEKYICEITVKDKNDKQDKLKSTSKTKKAVKADSKKRVPENPEAAIIEKKDKDELTKEEFIITSTDITVDDNTRIVTNKSPNVKSRCKKYMKDGEQYLDMSNLSWKNHIVLEKGYLMPNGISHCSYSYVYVHFNGHIYRIKTKIDNYFPLNNEWWQNDEYIRIDKVVY